MILTLGGSAALKPAILGLRPLRNLEGPCQALLHNIVHIAKAGGRGWWGSGGCPQEKNAPKQCQGDSFGKPRIPTSLQRSRAQSTTLLANARARAPRQKIQHARVHAYRGCPSNAHKLGFVYSTSIQPRILTPISIHPRRCGSRSKNWPGLYVLMTSTFLGL